MKILGSDYDGTLNYGGIDEEKIAAIQKWRAAGNLFGIVTGRGVEFCKKLLEIAPRLEYDFLVACNGGYITNDKGALIYEMRCDSLPIAEFAKDLLDLGCKHIHVNGTQYVCVVEDKENLPFLIPENQLYFVEEIPSMEYFNQISVQLPSVEEAALLTKKISEKYKQWVTPLQNGICIDIVPLGINKMQGLYRVMEYFHCAYEDVITVGDNFNDEDMIREFRSYAMENAVKEIRDLADETIGSVTELLEKELKK
jgi:HAD superfamily hydrolase (TIGR01484 family)